MWSYFNPVNVSLGRGTREKLFDQTNLKRVLIVSSKRGKSQFLKDKILREVMNLSDITWLDLPSNNPSFSDIENHINFINNRELIL